MTKEETEKIINTLEHHHQNIRLAPQSTDAPLEIQNWVKEVERSYREHMLEILRLARIGLKAETMYQEWRKFFEEATK